uniref:Uncharacterized protein n=1 Tax=Macrostomum lignano TaxID=282301 RepID=A0A1I8FIX1_9PLAT
TPQRDLIEEAAGELSEAASEIFTVPNLLSQVFSRPYKRPGRRAGRCQHCAAATAANFSPQPAQQPAAADCPGEQRLCLPADFEQAARDGAGGEAASLRGSLPIVAGVDETEPACDWSRLGLRCRAGGSQPGTAASIGCSRPASPYLHIDSAVSCVAPQPPPARRARRQAPGHSRTALLYQQFQPAPNEFQKRSQRGGAAATAILATDKATRSPRQRQRKSMRYQTLV